MSTSIPGQGEVYPFGNPITGGTVAPPQFYDDPATLGFKGRGMRIQLTRIPGITNPKLLQVPLRFQIPPLDTFQREYGYAHTDYETLRAGSFSRPNGRNLRTVTFQTMFIDWNPSWAVWPDSDIDDFDIADRVNIFNVVKMSNQLVGLAESGSPMLLSAGEMGAWGRYDLRFPVTLRSVRIEEKAGEVDARYVDVQFTEWRKLLLERRQVGAKSKAQPKTNAVRGIQNHLPTTIEIFSDGSAVDLETGVRVGTSNAPYMASVNRFTKRYYGDPLYYKVLYKINANIRGIPPNRSLGLAALKKGKGYSIRITIPHVDTALLIWQKLPADAKFF